MTCSPAQMAANRANSLRSTGPRTPEGKAISRRNALKHGLAGEGVVLPPTDADEVRRRSGAMLAQVAPRSEMGGYLVRRIARLTVCVERSGEQQDAAVAEHVRAAPAAFDEARVAAVDHLVSWIAKEPATYARQLRSTPEGVDRLILVLSELRDDLGSPRWDWNYGEKLANLLGLHYYDAPMPRVRALSEAVGGDFKYLHAGDGEGLDREARRHWARQELAGLIDRETDGLLEHRETLDHQAIEESRAGAGSRAGFDVSREAILARRYEAAAERAIYRALRELREVEAEARGAAPPEGPEGPEAGELGSSRAEPEAEAPEAVEPPASPPRRAPSAAPIPHSPPVRRWDEAPRSLGTPPAWPS